MGERDGERKKFFFLLKPWLSTLGGRTAWTTMVTIGSRLPVPVRIWAKFSYEVTFVNNAREDAAECALQHLQGDHPLGCTCGASQIVAGKC